MDRSTLSIRHYQPQDAAGISQLFYQSVRQLASRSYTTAQIEAWAPGEPDPEKVHAGACGGRLTLVAATEDGGVFGWTDMEPGGHIDHLFCHPAAAGIGLGLAMLDYLIGLAPPNLKGSMSKPASWLGRSSSGRILI